MRLLDISTGPKGRVRLWSPQLPGEFKFYCDTGFLRVFAKLWKALHCRGAPLQRGGGGDFTWDFLVPKHKRWLEQGPWPCHCCDSPAAI